MDNNELKTKIKCLSPSSLAEVTGGQLQNLIIIGGISPNEIVCPFCGNGTGDSHTGVDPLQRDDGTFTYHCFKCGENYDNLDIIANAFCLTTKENFPQVMKIARDLLDGKFEELDNLSKNTITVQNPNASQQQKPKRNFAKDISIWRQNLRWFLSDTKTGTYRGLTLDTLQHFQCGYTKHWRGIKDVPFDTARIIIPTSAHHYLARFVGDLSKYTEDQQEKISNHQKVHLGTKDIFPNEFNKWVRIAHETIKERGTDKIPALFFVVEGEFDAMTGWQVTRSMFSDGIRAQFIAFSGSSISKHMQEQLKQLPRCMFIVIPDNDDTGDKAADKFVATLTSLGHIATKRSIQSSNNDCKDLNEFLQKYPDELKTKLDSLFDRATITLQLFNKYGVKPTMNWFSTAPDDKDAFIDNMLKAKGGYQTWFKMIDDIGDKIIRSQAPEEKQEDVTPTKTYFATTRDELPNCPVNLSLPDNFKLDKFGLWRKKKMIGKNAGKENKHYTDHISNTPMVITQRLIDVDTSEESYEISWYDLNTDKWISGIIVPAADIANTTKCCTLTGRGLGIAQSDAKHISKYFVSMASNPYNRAAIPIIKYFNRAGWIDDDCSQFLYPARDNKNAVLKDNGIYFTQKFSEHGSFDAWKEIQLDLYRHELPIYLLTFGLALGAPLINVLGIRNQQLLLWCKTGSGKSAMIKNAMSIYGNPEELKITFDGTSKALTEYSSAYNDLALWIDEFQSADILVRKELDRFIYKYAEKKGRQRLKKNGQIVETRPFCGVRLMTGEEPMLKEESNAGGFNRLLQISTSELFSKDYNLRKLHTLLDKHNGFFGPMWINFIIEHKAEIVQTFENSLATFENAEEKYQWFNGWAATFALVVTTIQYAFPMLDDSIKPEGVVKMFYDNFGVIKKEVPLKTTMENWQRALIALQDYVVSHPRNFKIEKFLTGAEGEPISNQTVLGYKTEDGAGYVYQGVILKNGTAAIFPGELKKILTDELKFSSPAAVIRGWADNKQLTLPSDQTSKDAKTRPYQFRRRLPDGSRPFAYWFEYNTLITDDNVTTFYSDDDEYTD